jgi:hypothetical protein
LGRLAAHHPTYAEWTVTDLRDVLAYLGITPQKSDGRMVIRAEDVSTALRDRTTDHIREATRERPGNQGELPDPSPLSYTWPDQRKYGPGGIGNSSRTHRKPLKTKC